MSLFLFHRRIEPSALSARRLVAPVTVFTAVAMLIMAVAVPRPLIAQENGVPLEGPQAIEQQVDPQAGEKLAEAERLADEALAADEQPADESQAEEAAPPEAPRVNILELFYKGGYLMYPIVVMSVVVVVFGFERWLGLRRGRVIPRRLVRGLNELTAQPKGFNPQAAYRLCRQYDSPAARVIRTALLKTGRPLLEIEHAVNDAREREADRLYKNVRPIALAVTITPLLGLLGTVWGMIEAFFVTASNPVGVNRAESLAHGIYTALVTTFGGLAVAIPAAILAHYFEGRIQSLFHRVDDLVQGVMPKLARFEGKVRVDSQVDGDELETLTTRTNQEKVVTPPPVTPPAVVTE